MSLTEQLVLEEHIIFVYVEVKLLSGVMETVTVYQQRQQQQQKCLHSSGIIDNCASIAEAAASLVAKLSFNFNLIRS